VEGYLDLRDEGYGFLRLGGYLGTRNDAYVSVRFTRQYGLRMVTTSPACRARLVATKRIRRCSRCTP